MNAELAVQAGFYCLVLVLFPLGAIVTRGWERAVVLSFMFICSLAAAERFGLEPATGVIFAFVVPLVLLVPARILYEKITDVECEQGRKGSTPARQQ